VLPGDDVVATEPPDDALKNPSALLLSDSLLNNLRAAYKQAMRNVRGNPKKAEKGTRQGDARGGAIDRAV